MKNFKNIFLVSFLFLFLNMHSQPSYLSKQVIDSIEVYQDYVKKNNYYYAPLNLKLKVDKQGKPSFQFLKMVYTGSKCYSDQGEKHFTNIVTFTVEMEQYPTSTIKSIAKKLKTTSLKPLPISNIESQLIFPMLTEGLEVENLNLGEKRSLEAVNKESLSTNKTFWLTRTFTVRLDNKSANLLSNQLIDSQLALGFNYSFYADMKLKNTSEMELTGSKEVVDAMNRSLDSVADINKTVIVKSNTFQINIDLNSFPEVVKTIDLNEGIPPTYPAVEIKCYDFTENLRPDLYLKKVEISAKSVDGKKEVIAETKFYKKHKDLYTQYIHFPYAIDMESPMKYRVTDINSKGEQHISTWKNKEECSDLIDVSTPIKDINFYEYKFEVNLDEAIFKNSAIETVIMEITYLLNKEIQSEELVFKNSDEFFIKNSLFYYDKNTLISFQLIKKINDGSELKTKKQELNKDYIYISENNFQQ